jgi:hypothetical protein
MALSKSGRIQIMLVIDATFLILELGVGIAVGSLALLADAFHMVSRVKKVTWEMFPELIYLVKRYYISGCWIMGSQSCAKIVDRQILVRGV